VKESDVTNIVLELSPGAELKGQLRVEGGPLASQPKVEVPVGGNLPRPMVSVRSRSRRWTWQTWLRTNSNHQPLVSHTDSVAGRDLWHSLDKRVFAFQYLKTNSPHLCAYQSRVDLVISDLIYSGLGSMGGETVVCYDQTATRFECRKICSTIG